MASLTLQVSGHIRERKLNDNKVSYQLIAEINDINNPTFNRIRRYKTIRNCTKKEAERLLREFINEIETNTHIEKVSTLLKDYMPSWFELYVKDFISPTTCSGYENQINRYILPQLGEYKIQSITTSIIQNWINQLYVKSPCTNNPLSAKTVKNIYLNLKNCLDRAEAESIIKVNPCKYIKLKQIHTPEQSVYDLDEVHKLLNLSKGTDLELPMLLEVTLGLRRGELLGLKWKHIDFENSTVKIIDNLVQVKGELITKLPKTVSGQRTLEIPMEVMEILKVKYSAYISRKLAMGKTFNDGNYVISQFNGLPYKPDSFTQKYKRFLKQNNFREIKLHSLRHTNATIMLQSGISAKVAQARLGHSDVSTTLNIYSHVLTSMDKEAANTIGNTLFNNKGEIA
ncbi:MAG: tyrosine-type recombinase/integrase [Oscillospiraceae bacterium]